MTSSSELTLEELDDIEEDYDETEDEEDEEDEDYMPRREEPRAEIANAVEKFLGPGKTIERPIVMERYYGDLLASILKSYIKAKGWNVVKTLGSQPNQPPHYIKANIGPGKHVKALARGFMLLRRGQSRLVARIEIRWRGGAMLVVIGSASLKAEVKTFASDIEKSTKDLKLYKGQKLRFSGRIRFLEPADKSWADLALDAQVKQELVANTVGFLRRSKEFAKFGIPAKRGLILAGAPGTGKTLISKVLISNSPGITCLTADPSMLEGGCYIPEIYEIANDLRPTILFLEDIDLIGQDRYESQYSKSAPMAALLDALDGVQECDNVVTIATTNCPDILDNALKQRPSRFDRIITMPLPSRNLRREIVNTLSKKIPLDDTVLDYITEKTDKYTPAQIQEVVYSLVIRRPEYGPDNEIEQAIFSKEEVDNVLQLVSRKNGEPMGFKIPSNDRDRLGINDAVYSRNDREDR